MSHIVDYAHHLWVDDTVPRWGSSREPMYEIMQVWWGSRAKPLCDSRVVQVWWGSGAEPLCDSRIVQVWWGSWAEPMCYQSRADSSVELLWSQSSAGSEEVPVENHDDCFSGKQWVWSVRLDQIQTSLYIQMTMKQPNPFRGSLIQRKPEEARNPSPYRMPRCWRLPSLLRGSVDYYSCRSYLMYCINPRRIYLVIYCKKDKSAWALFIKEKN